MLRNYLVTALRNLARNRLYAAITLLGLAVAFTVAILVGQFVRGEFSYDRWIPDHRHIYKITSRVEPPGQKPLTLDATPGLASELRAGFPGLVAVARLSENGPAVRRDAGDPGATEWLFAWADPDFFKVFPLPALAGDPASALQQPDTVVITRRMARKYFHRDLPLGNTLEVQTGDGRWRRMRVAAVLKDLPANTSLKDEIFASGRSAYSKLSDIDAHLLPGSFRLGLSTFARLSPGRTAADLQRALGVAGRPDMEASLREGDRMSFHPAPLDDVHWLPKVGPASPALNAFFLSQLRMNLYLDLVVQAETMAICAGLAILLACLGLFALAAYMTERRTKEIGIRKAMGAGKWDVVRLLLWQFTLPVLCAVAVAAPVGFIAMHDWLSQFAYSAPLSAWTFGLAAGAAVAIAWLTVGWQSYAAARAKPAGALQYE